MCLLQKETFHCLKFCFWEVRVHCRTFWLVVTENEISQKKTVTLTWTQLNTGLEFPSSSLQDLHPAKNTCSSQGQVGLRRQTCFSKTKALPFKKKDWNEVKDCNLKTKVSTAAGCGQLMLYKFFRTPIFQWLSWWMNLAACPQTIWDF